MQTCVFLFRSQFSYLPRLIKTNRSGFPSKQRSLLLHLKSGWDRLRHLRGGCRRRHFSFVLCCRRSVDTGRTFHRWDRTGVGRSLWATCPSLDHFWLSWNALALIWLLSFLWASGSFEAWVASRTLLHLRTNRTRRWFDHLFSQQLGREFLRILLEGFQILPLWVSASKGQRASFHGLLDHKESRVPGSFAKTKSGDTSSGHSWKTVEVLLVAGRQMKATAFCCLPG